jgi:hypothetical protein
MPNEEVLKKGDLSRELCLVLHGACRLMEDEKVKRIVRDDVSAHLAPYTLYPKPKRKMLKPG